MNTQSIIKILPHELKFRVWSFLDKSFHYFTIYEGVPSGIAGGLSEPQQYTGKKDKHGKDIYEGDIIIGLHDFGPGGFAEKIAVISWNNEEGSYQWNYWDMFSIEITGNIFNACKPDNNGECFVCDCWLCDCPLLS